MSRPPAHVREELTAAGASASEAHELSALAGQLKQLNGKQPQPAFTWRHGRFRLLLPLSVTAVTGIALGMALVIFSQTVLPGSRLYAIQKLSDHVAVSVDPDYRGVVMMKRAQEVKQLVADHAGPHVVLATLADYSNEASAYTSVPGNYAAFEYCKDNLQQAELLAPNSERKAIASTLSSLSSV